VDYKSNNMASVGDVNQYMGKNPTAAGSRKNQDVFIYNETVGEYHLQ